MTTKLYLHAVHEFFQWRRGAGGAFCRLHVGLDIQLAEYINFLYVSGNPMYNAANALSGFKRSLPKYREALEMSSLYFVLQKMVQDRSTQASFTAKA